jgi:DhnA family fructose-bisphosphate aldolase class Ia
LKKYYREFAGNIPVILTVPLDPYYVDITVKMDAAAVKWHYFGPENQVPWTHVNRFTMKCMEEGMPFLFEPVIKDKRREEGGENITDPVVILSACLKAVANGVDFLKTNYSGTPESFRKITSRCPVPIVILGSPLVTDKECLERIKGCIESGGAGGAIGRNATTHRDPEKIVRAICRIVHDDACVEEALRELEKFFLNAHA